MHNTKKILSYDRTNPVLYDNDSHSDVFTDELLLALASAGEIDLRGFITTSPENPCVNRETYECDAAGRAGIVALAHVSGMKNLPAVVRGPSKPLAKPNSGRVEDTAILDTPGSRLIVCEAAKASPEQPLVIVMGGPLTAVADAYLLDPGIAGRTVVAWVGGFGGDAGDYNGFMDRWAAYIAVSRLQIVQFPVSLGMPRVSKDKLKQLPESPLGQWMIEKRLPHVNRMPDGLVGDGDGNPVISLLNESFILDCKRMSFDRWDVGVQGLAPTYRDDPQGNILLVTRIDRKLAEEEWWKAISDPKAWAGRESELVKALRPFYAAPFPIGKIHTIEAEDFNHGGEGKAYHSVCNNGFEKIYRPANVKITRAYDSPGGYNMGLEGGYCLTGLHTGEWFTYTIAIECAGTYEVLARVASEGKGGQFHFEFGDVKTGTLTIPDTVQPFRWETLQTKPVSLCAGEQVVTLRVDDAGPDGRFGSINYFQLVPVDVHEQTCL